MHRCLVITTRPPEPDVKAYCALSEKAKQELCVLVNALLILEDMTGVSARCVPSNDLL